MKNVHRRSRFDRSGVTPADPQGPRRPRFSFSDSHLQRADLGFPGGKRRRGRRSRLRRPCSKPLPEPPADGRCLVEKALVRVGRRPTRRERSRVIGATLKGVNTPIEEMTSVADVDRRSQPPAEVADYSKATRLCHTWHAPDATKPSRPSFAAFFRQASGCPRGLSGVRGAGI